MHTDMEKWMSHNVILFKSQRYFHNLTYNFYFFYNLTYKWYEFVLCRNLVINNICSKLRFKDSLAYLEVF